MYSYNINNIITVEQFRTICESLIKDINTDSKVFYSCMAAGVDDTGFYSDNDTFDRTWNNVINELDLQHD